MLRDDITMVPIASLTRNLLGYSDDPAPEKHSRVSHVPKFRPGESKSLIVKVQLPFDFEAKQPLAGSGELLVYTKKRDFVCFVRKVDNPTGYDRLAHVVRMKGAIGSKAYFAAELKSKDELVVKVAEVLAEQPF